MGVVPSDVLSDLQRTVYNITKWPAGGHPDDSVEFDKWESDPDTSGDVDGSGPMSRIVSGVSDAGNNPYGDNDYYFTLIKGKLTVPVSGTYEFAVDGDDAVDFTIDDNFVVGYYGGHDICQCNDHSKAITLTAGKTYDIKFRHEDQSGGDRFVLKWKMSSAPASNIVDYNVNVEVCKTGLLEGNCRAYSDGSTTTYKPAGILQRYGEDELMAFGLLTGSYQKNTSGGVLRKNISSFKDEIDLNTGIFTNVNGIIDTIDKLRIARFQYTNHQYKSGWTTDRPINEGEAQDWETRLQKCCMRLYVILQVSHQQQKLMHTVVAQQTRL